jgi:hypothetical protein
VGPLHLDEFYVGADTRAALCDIDSVFQTASDPNSGDPNCKKRSYLFATRSLDTLARFASSMTLDLNFSMVPKFQSSLLVTDPGAISYPSWSKTITGSFNPAKLFRSSTELKGVAGYVGKIPALSGENVDVALRSLCGTPGADPLLHIAKSTDDCLRHITVGSTFQRTVLLTVPRINVTATTPFDLTKVQSSFVPPPNKAGKSLYNVTLNWDLRSIFASTTTRLDAINALKSSDPAAQKPQSEIDNARLQARRQVAMMFMELKLDRNRSQSDIWWDRFEALALLVD